MGADIYVLESQGERTLTRVCAELRSLAYLLALGYSRGQLLRFRQVASELLIAGLDGDDIDSRPYRRRLQAAFLSNPDNRA